MLWFLLMNQKGYQLNCATGNSHGDWSRVSLRETSGVAWMNILGIQVSFKNEKKKKLILNIKYFTSE